MTVVPKKKKKKKKKKIHRSCSASCLHISSMHAKFQCCMLFFSYNWVEIQLLV